ncbi:MAG: phosphatidylserine decarboxylase [Candidatus Acidiferrales bacterium]|jgi:phosphatidylserine decarboxylase
MVKEGYWIGIPLFVVGGVALFLGSYGIPFVCFLLAAFVFYFFRDPEREVPDQQDCIVSPADGLVVVVTPEEWEGRPGKRISIFLAVWDVHVNRSPAAGRIVNVIYKPGRFFVAARARASAENEQNVIRLETETGEIVFKQIAGWIARRVVCWKAPGSVVARGERIGLIRFGSRMDVWLPGDAEVLVSPGERVSAGSSVLAHWPVRNAGQREAAEVLRESSELAGSGAGESHG